MQKEEPIDVAGASASEPHKAHVPQDSARLGCINCGNAGRPVTRKTMLLMLKPELFESISNGEYRFCSDPKCRIVYFTKDDGASFNTDDLRVRVGIKEREDPIPLCYCFGFNEADVRDEIKRTGETSIEQRITMLLKEGMCACLARNPSGACCFGEVSKAVQRLMSEAVIRHGK